MAAPDQQWDAQFADFLVRVVAARVAGTDLTSLRLEYARLLSSAPPGKKQSLNLKELT
jgi:hypothetical protein